MTEHEKEVKELFENHSLPLDNSNPDTRVMSFELFKACIDIMMDKAYYYGKAETTQQYSEMIDEIFPLKK